VNDVVEVLEIVGLVLVVLFLLGHARSQKGGGCGCSSKAVDDVTPSTGACS
jgi:hypothetical protein